MSSKVWLFISALTVAAAAMSVACGDDDTNGSSSGTGTSSGNPEAGTSSSSGTSGVPEGGTSSGCTFAGFVNNLITTQTTPTAVPSTDLGEKCTDSTSQDDFKSLFQ